MSASLRKTLIYILAVIFIIANLFLLREEIYFGLALPAVVLVIWLLVYKPLYLLYFLAFATPLSLQLSSGADSLSMSIPTEPLIILLFIAVVLRIIKSKSLDLRIFHTVLAILISVDLVWLAVTTISSSMPLISVKYLMSKTWYLIVFYYLLTYLFKKEQVIKTFMWAFVIATVILAAYTLFNHAQGGFSRSYAYTAMRPFLPDHGMYAACISFSVPILFVFSFYGHKLNYSTMTRVVAIGLFAFMVFAVAMSFTRASWLSLVVSFAVFGALLLRIKFQYLFVLAIAGISLVAFNFDDLVTDLSRNTSESDDNIEEHLNSVSNVHTDPSNMERLNRWSCAYRMFEEKPLLGFGPGTYTFQYGVYQLPHQMTIISTNTGSLGNVHSEYLRPLVESGLIGMLLLLSIVITSIYMGFHQFNNLVGQSKWLSLAAFLALLTYFAHGVMNNYSEFDKIAVPLYACLAVLTAYQMRLKQNHDQQADTK